MDSVGCLTLSKVYLLTDGSERKAKQKKVKTEEKNKTLNKLKQTSNCKAVKKKTKKKNGFKKLK